MIRALLPKWRRRWSTESPAPATASPTGELGPARRWLRSHRRALLLATPLAAAALAYALAWLVPLPARLAVPPSTVIAYADGSPAYVFLSPDDKVRIRAELDA